MTAKKDESSEPSTVPDVDMDRIKKMMGPLPDEKQAEILAKASKSKKKISVQHDSDGASKDVSAAAEEANASIKAMSPDLGQADITRLDDEPSGEDVASDELLDELAKHNDAIDAALGEPEPIKDDMATVSAVDDIVSHEGDTVLEAEDQKRSGGEKKTLDKESFRDKLKNIWAKPAVRWGTIITLFILLIGAALYPTSRYYVLNQVGVRASMSVTVIDSSTLQPLKNVSITAAGVTTQTDSNGAAKLQHLKLGASTLVISKRAFATINQQVTVGWGSNPKGQIRLAASGAQYSFLVTDFLSGKPIEKAEATSGDGDAVSDKDGRIVLTLDTSSKNDSDEISVQISAASYRLETVKITASNKEVSAAKMVPVRKNVFVSKRTGTYDLYTIDIDAKNEQKIVTGTGLERDDLALAPQQNSDIAAYVATRENARNSDGYLLSTLYLLDTKSGSLTKVDQSEQIQLVGWSSDQHLVYIKIAAGASGANPKRQRLMSVNAKNSSDNKELASANYFNDALLANNRVLYAPSNAFQDNPKPGLFAVLADNTAPVTITDKEVLNIFRTDYETIVFDSGGSYYSYKVAAAPSSVAAASNPSGVNRLYADNTGNNRSLWFDSRDGKGVLLSYDKIAKKDTVLATKSGLKLPLFWLNDTTVIFRVNDGKEIADYAISTAGGEAKKIQNVSDTSGIGRWFYY